MSLPARSTFVLVLLATMAPPSGAAERKEFLLKYRLSGSIEEEVGFGGQHLELVNKKKPAGALPALPSLKEEPTYRGEPLYAALKLGVNKAMVALVLDNASLYVDVDRDSRITAAERLTGSEHGRGTAFGPVRLLVDGGADECPQWFVFRLYEYKSEGQVLRTLSAVNAGFYRGVVTFGEEKRLLAVVDANGNGIYNERMKGDSRACDRLLIDDNNDGKLDGRYQSEEAQPLGPFVLIGDKYWKLQVAADGSSVVVEPLDKPLGTVHSTQKDYMALLSGEEGVIRIRSQDGSARLPEGTYRLAQCRYHQLDKGRRWEFSSLQTESALVNVVAHKTTVMPLGPPLVPKVLVTQTGADLALNLVLRGAGGELYSDVQVGAEMPPAPKVRITDAVGRELALLDFHYG